MWFDARGNRLPAPFLPGFDTLGTLDHLRHTGFDHSWFVLNRSLAGKEFALSGSEQNLDLTEKRYREVLRRPVTKVTPSVQAFLDHGEDWVTAATIGELVGKMNALTPDAAARPGVHRAAGRRARPAGRATRYTKDAQVAAIRVARRYRGDRITKRAYPLHRILDPKYGPLVAVRLRVLSRKTLGGLHTDLSGGCSGRRASRCPVCTPRARSPGSAAVGCTGTARWRGRSSGAASSPGGPRAEPPRPRCERDPPGRTAGRGDGIRVVPLRHHRDFRRYWLARQVSIAGTLVTAVALPVLVYRLTGSPSLTALITVVEGVPYLLFGLFSGALSDRLDRQRVMVVADVVAGLTIASVPIAFWLGSLTAVHALVAGFLAQTAFVFFDGAAFGALPAIVGRDRIGSANSALWGFGSLLDLGIPMLAGVLLAVVHPATLLGLDALSFLLSAACVASIRTRLSPERSGVPPLRPRVLLAEVAVGLRFLWGHAGVRSQTVVGFLLSLSGAGFMSLSVPYADRLLGVGTSGWRFGLVFAAWGVGGIIVAVFTPRLLRFVSPNRLALIWLPFAGAAGVVVATASTWQVAVAVMVVRLQATARRVYLQARLAWFAGEPEQAESLATEAWSRGDELSPDHLGSLAAILSQLHNLRADGLGAAEWAARALALGLPPDLADSTNAAQAFGLALVGRIEEALAVLEPVPSDPTLVRGYSHQLISRGALRVATDDLAGARRDLDLVCNASHAEVSPQRLLAMGALAEVEFRLGAWDASLAYAEHALSLAEDAEQLWVQGYLHVAAIMVCAGRGDWAQAERHLVAGTRPRRAARRPRHVRGLRERRRPHRLVPVGARRGRLPLGAPAQPRRRADARAGAAAVAGAVRRRARRARSPGRGRARDRDLRGAGPRAGLPVPARRAGAGPR